MALPLPAPPLSVRPLLLVFMIVSVLVLDVRNVLLSPNSTRGLLYFIDSVHSFTLFVSSRLLFFGYSLGAYLILHFLYRRIGLSAWVVLPSILLLVVCCIVLRAFVQEGIFFQLFGRYNYNPSLSWAYYFLDNTYYALLFVPIGVIYFYYRLSRHNERSRFLAEQSRREAELKFLRTQLNPHFLFNILNNLYALVESGSDRALPILDRLGNILRYSLYQQRETATLEREIAYLNDLIYLERLRIPGCVAPVFRVGPFSREWRIPPLLLIPFVENAFKHGDLSRPNAPLRIALTEPGPETLRFQITNAIREHSRSKDGVGGIGLENVRRRLGLLYPDRHRLEIKEVCETYSVDLVLNQAQRVD